MYNGSIQNDHMIKAHTSEPYSEKNKKRVTESQNTIVISKKKHKKTIVQRILGLFRKK